jgi:hypothetical protein
MTPWVDTLGILVAISPAVGGRSNLAENPQLTQSPWRTRSYDAIVFGS